MAGTWARRVMRLPVLAFTVGGVLAPAAMTALFLFLAMHANQRRLAEVQRSAAREARVVLARRMRALDRAAVPVEARVDDPRPSLMTAVALSSDKQVAFSYQGNVLTVGDGGRDMRLNGRSIDAMSKQELLRDLHQLGQRFVDRNRR